MIHDFLSRWLRPGRWWKEVDLVVLLSGLILTLSGWCFLVIANHVSTGQTSRLDERLILALRNPDDPSDPIGPEWVEEAFRDFTAMGGTAVLSLLTSIVVGFLLLNRKYHAACLVLVATLGGLFLSNSLKAAFDRPRPALVPHLSFVSNSSFPSGHSMLSAVIYLTLASLLDTLVRRKAIRIYLLGVAMLLSFLVGTSRVYLGVHYPSDVVGGWIVGLVWALLCWLGARRLQRRGLIEQTAD